MLANFEAFYCFSLLLVVNWLRKVTLYMLSLGCPLRPRFLGELSNALAKQMVGDIRLLWPLLCNFNLFFFFYLRQRIFFR